MKEYVYNPKCEGSGLITCTTNTKECPRQCPDCFANAGRAYTTLPNIPTEEQAHGNVVRIGDIADPHYDFQMSKRVAKIYEDAFFNTSYQKCVLRCTAHSIPVVLTVNPGVTRGQAFRRFPEGIPDNLMYVRALIDVDNVVLVNGVIQYYAPLGDHGRRKVPVILTWFAFYETDIPKKYKETKYTWRKRTQNPYWCIKDGVRRGIEAIWSDNPMVHTCGYKGHHACKNCGNCIREYYATRERLKS